MRRIPVQIPTRGQEPIKALLFLFLLLIPLNLSAEENDTIHCDLETCIEIAITNYPKLKAGRARLNAAKAASEIKRKEQRPNLDMEVNIGHFSGETISPFGILGSFTEEGLRQRHISGEYYQTTAGLQIPIVKEGAFLFQTPSSVRKADLGMSEAEWENQAIRTEVALKVAEAYIDFLKQLKAIKIFKEIVTLLEMDFNLARTKFDQELISRNDLLIAEVRLAMAKKDLSLSQLALQKSQKALASSIRADKVSHIEIEDLQGASDASSSLDIPVILSQEDNPELKAQKYRLFESREEVRRVQSERYPTASLLTHYSVADDFSRPGNDQWAAVFNVKVPIFDFGLSREKLAFANAKAMEEEEHLLDLKMDIEQEIYEIYFYIQKLEEHIELIGKQIDQAAEALKLNRAMFEQDLLSQSALHDTESALLKLQLEKVSLEYDLKLAHFRLRLVSGKWVI